MRINVENLHFSYSENSKVLHGIDLHVEESEIVCIVGPNGSGKSTLIKCMESLLKPKTGRVLLDGRYAGELTRMEIACMLGYVPQSTNQSFSTTVFDTVLMGRRPYSSWHSSEEDIDTVIELLSRMELEDIALHDFNHLSGGQQQRVLIARALAQDPKALLLDEPTSALDIAYQMEVMDIIKALVAEKQISVVMIVHDLNLASRYADRIVMLNKGKIVSEGSPEQVFTKRTLAEVYGIDAIVQKNDGIISVLPYADAGKGNMP